MLKQQTVSQKRQIFLLVVLMIFLTATVFLLYKNFWSKEGLRISLEKGFIFKEPLPGEFSEGEKEFIPLSELTERLFQEDKFKALEPHGELPVEAGKTGRSNPFMPF